MLSVCLSKLSPGNIRTNKMTFEEGYKKIESFNITMQIFLLLATVIVIIITVVLMLK